MEIEYSRSALLIIHCQGDMVRADGAFAPLFRAKVESRNVLEVIGHLLGWARENEVTVIYTRVAFAPDYSNLLVNNELFAATKQLGSLKDGSKLAEIIDELAPHPGERVVTHQRVGAFSGTDLHELLRQHAIDTVLLAGVATNVSVETTARYASDCAPRARRETAMT